MQSSSCPVTPDKGPQYDRQNIQCCSRIKKWSDRSGPYIDIWECGEPITDERDGQSYNTVLIGDQCWMKENLNIGMQINGIQITYEHILKEMSDN